VHLYAQASYAAAVGLEIDAALESGALSAALEDNCDCAG